MSKLPPECDRRPDVSPFQPIRAAWSANPASIRPTVLVLGGFLTAPPLYRRMVRRLADRGAAAVVVASVWTPDWLIASTLGPGPIATRSGRALKAAGLASTEASEGAPVLVVGHSAGGLIARLLTGEEPIPGRRFGAARRIGAIVTLGTPHDLSRGAGVGRRLHDLIGSIVEAGAPGCCHSPSVGYLSVASRAIVSDPNGSGRQRVADVLYRSVMGRSATAGTEGDGLVPVPSTVLPGAQHVIVDNALHGPSAGAPWYGTDDAMDVWWPLALGSWREALRYRASAASRVAAS